MESQGELWTGAVVCPACGTDNIVGTEACTECGVSLSEEYLAPKPGDEVLGVFTRPISELDPCDAVCLGHRSSLTDVIALLKGRNVGCVLITGDDGRLVGVFTEGDAHYKVAGLIRDLDSIPVESLMTRNPSVLRPDMPIGHALQLMGLHGFRHVPLVDTDNVPVGFISFRDICEFIEDNFAEPGSP